MSKRKLARLLESRDAALLDLDQTDRRQLDFPIVLPPEDMLPDCRCRLLRHFIGS